MCRRERICKVGQTGCAYERICLENMVFIVQNVNIRIWGFTRLCG